MVFDKEYFIRRLLYFLFGYKPQRLAGILLGFIGVLLDYPKENLRKTSDSSSLSLKPWVSTRS